jgi:hypothetical protein
MAASSIIGRGGKSDANFSDDKRGIVAQVISPLQSAAMPFMPFLGGSSIRTLPVTFI